MYAAVSSGGANVIALSTDGRVYEWGNIWQGNKWKVSLPRLVSGNLDSRRVTQIACGQFHTLALTQEGELYSWGINACGQLGIGNNTAHDDPVKVSGLHGFDKTIVSITCSGWASFALDNEGVVSS